MVKQYAESPGLRFCKIRYRTKKPFETDWVNKPYSWVEIQEHIKSDTNYGVLCGYGGVAVIDCDEPELHEKVRTDLPATFEVLTGSGGKHCYYFCPELKKKIVLQNETKHYGEIQSFGAQVVAAGSLHPEGGEYRVHQDLEIATVSLEQLMLCVKPFVKEVAEAERTAVAENREFTGGDDLNTISITSVINTAGFKRGGNGEIYGSNPWHGSTSGMNFWVNASKNVGICFRCENVGISVAKAIALNEGIISTCRDELRGEKFIQTRKVAEEKYGLKPRWKSEVEHYNHDRVNFIEDPFFNTWKKVKGHTVKLIEKSGGLMFLSHNQDYIKGKVVPLSQTLQRVVLVNKIERKNEKGEVSVAYKFLDEKHDGRMGHPVDSLAFDFWLYRLIYRGREFIVFSQEPLEADEYELKGMIIQMDNFSEVSRTLKFKSLTPVFMVNTVKSSVQSLSKHDLAAFTKRLRITQQDFADMVFCHPDGKVYGHVPAYNLLRIAQLLSGKYEGYPLHTLTIGKPGMGKTIEQEALDSKFNEEKGIFEAGNSTIKGLIPSFKEKPASPGYILQCHRMALVDELFKMIDAAAFSSEQLLRHQLGQLNMLLEHKKRTIGSGNDNAVTTKATAKLVFSTNPLSNKDVLADHLRVIDASTLSRILIWVQDREHCDKISQKEAPFVQNTAGYIYTSWEKFHKNGAKNREGESYRSHGVLYNYIDDIRSDFLTIFDSSQQFLCEMDSAIVRGIFESILDSTPEPIKTLWRARGMHHTTLLLDGLVKYRCLFRDYDSTFQAQNEDYDLLLGLVTRISETWKTNLSPLDDWRNSLRPQHEPRPEFEVVRMSQ